MKKYFFNHHIQQHAPFKGDGVADALMRVMHASITFHFLC
jgi:hypothetical protein